MDPSGNLTQIKMVDFEENISIFEFDYKPNGTSVRVQYPREGFERTFDLGSNASEAEDTGSGRRTRRLGSFPPQNHENLRNAGRTSSRLGRHRHLQTSDTTLTATVPISTKTCNEPAEPARLRVTATDDDGNVVPVEPTRLSRGNYEVVVPVEETALQKVEDVADDVCEVVSTISEICSFLDSKWSFPYGYVALETVRLPNR